MKLWTYSPENISVTIAGLISLQGFAEGTFLNVTKDAPAFDTRRMSDGTLVRLHQKDATYTITFTLMNSSPSNDALTKLWYLDNLTRRGKFPLLISDGSGSSTVFSTNSWVESVPDMTFGTDMTTRDWTIKSAHAIVNYGGNGDVGFLSSLLTGVLGGLTEVAGFLE